MLWLSWRGGLYGVRPLAFPTFSTSRPFFWSLLLVYRTNDERDTRSGIGMASRGTATTLCSFPDAMLQVCVLPLLPRSLNTPLTHLTSSSIFNSSDAGTFLREGSRSHKSQRCASACSLVVTGYSLALCRF